MWRLFCGLLNISPNFDSLILENEAYVRVKDAGFGKSPVDIT